MVVDGGGGGGRGETTSVVSFFFDNVSISRPNTNQPHTHTYRIQLSSFPKKKSLKAVKRKKNYIQLEYYPVEPKNQESKKCAMPSKESRQNKKTRLGQ